MTDTPSYILLGWEKVQSFMDRFDPSKSKRANELLFILWCGAKTPGTLSSGNNKWLLRSVCNAQGQHHILIGQRLYCCWYGERITTKRPLYFKGIRIIVLIDITVQ
jgi:hypothetical protein